VTGPTGVPGPEDRRLRELFQGLPRERAAGETCPDPAELWAAARGEAAPDRLRWIVGHTARCASCAEDWRLARHVERGREERISSIAAAPRQSGSPFPARFTRLAAAAALVLAAGVGALWVAQGRLGDLGGQQVAERGEAASIEALTPEDEPLPRTDPVLRWRGPESAPGVEEARYDLTVTTERARILHRAERLRETEYRLPAEAIGGLRSGTVLLWQVEATLPDGSRVSSATYRVQLE
jgi:hypothetical protein